MIKLGKLTKQTVDKEFPDNWKSLATMLGLEYTENIRKEGTEDQYTQSLELDFTNNIFISIDKDNGIQTNGILNNEHIASIILELAKNNK